MRTCCHIGCDSPATVELWGNRDRYDYTDLCDEHTAEYKGGNEMIVPIGSEGVMLAGIPFDELPVNNNQ